MAEPVRHVDDLHRPADFPVDADGPPRRHEHADGHVDGMPMEHGGDIITATATMASCM
jgi:hypothetical protein